MNRFTKILLGGLMMLAVTTANAAEAVKSIVIYFSRTGENYSVGVIQEGNTAKVAKEIASQTGADLWELKEAEPYPVKYDDCIARARKELQAKARPAFQGTAPDLSKYDVVYLGYPNWWGEAPMVIYSLLEKMNIDGKTILPFCTHEGSGLGSTARNLAQAFPKAKIEQNGLSIYGHVAQKDAKEVKKAVAEWLSKYTKPITEKGANAMNNSKALVVCFSATGTTKGVAQRLATAIGAEFAEIVPAKPYTAADLNWRDKKSRSSVEMADRQSRPAIATAVPNLADYPTVFVGFPIWWYREPSIIDTFVESNAEALAGKTIVPFATSGGSGMGDSTANLQALAPKAKVTAGRRFSSSVNADMLKAWAEEIAK